MAAASLQAAGPNQTAEGGGSLDIKTYLKESPPLSPPTKAI